MTTIYRRNPHADHHRHLLASHRRLLLGHWQAQLDQIARTPIRTPEERKAKAEALARMEAFRA